ncbi:MAG: hypothetical protein GY954_04965, partial [Alteromonas sp.]|nr:hypothetical protein [Alteromonas sp.]
RQERLKDPLDRDGGSEKAIAQERQAMHDLLERKVKIRRAIQQANEATALSINGINRTIADWLVWRREVAPFAQGFLSQMSRGIQAERQNVRRKGLSIVNTGNVATNPDDLIINVNERELAKELENMEDILGTLDGQLSLKNATIFIEL